MKTKFALILFAVLLCLSAGGNTCVSEDYFKLTGSCEYVDNTVLPSVKFAFSDPFFKSHPSLVDFTSISLGCPANKSKNLFYSVNFLKMISTFEEAEPKFFSEIEILNWKQNYGDYKTSLKILSFAYRFDAMIYAKSEGGGGYDSINNLLYDSWIEPPHILFLLRAGISSEYAKLESLPDNQKWYVGPTVSTGIAAWFSDFSAIAHVKFGLMKAETTTEIVTWLGRRNNFDLRLFYNAEYFYPYGSSRRKYLQSAGLKMGYTF